MCISHGPGRQSGLHAAPPTGAVRQPGTWWTRRARSPLLAAAPATPARRTPAPGVAGGIRLSSTHRGQLRTGVHCAQSYCRRLYAPSARFVAAARQALFCNMAGQRTWASLCAARYASQAALRSLLTARSWPRCHLGPLHEVTRFGQALDRSAVKVPHHPRTSYRH